MKTVTWISGWACPAEATQAFAQSVCPEAAHEIFLPTSICTEKMDTSSGAPSGVVAETEAGYGAKADIIVGYSTGAFLLLGAWDKLPSAARVVLVAPFADFRAESGRGGKTPAAKLRFLLRWLRRDPLAALQDFYQRAGLGEPPAGLPYAQEELVWGIEQLAEVAQPGLAGQTDPYPKNEYASPASAARDSRCLTVLVGDQDTLLDAEALRADFPMLTVVPGAGHALADFRKELTDALR
ncbi:MAG: alpha/beta fold hydrolase [Verrucomicrobiota bacterium JB024]|nr:alpha/beta fold hydrolase [Verrucomicrobiota bacterium JB024]